MKKATDFQLENSRGEKVRLSDIWAQGAVLFVFYPGDFTRVCTAQLCEYRDHHSEFVNLGVRIVGISPDAPAKHAEFAQHYGFPFELLSDPTGQVAKSWGCTSFWTFGIASRAVCLVSAQGEILWKHVEPVAITRRSASELSEVIQQFRSTSRI